MCLNYPKCIACNEQVPNERTYKILHQSQNKAQLIYVQPHWPLYKRNFHHSGS